MIEISFMIDLKVFLNYLLFINYFNLFIKKNN